MTLYSKEILMRSKQSASSPKMTTVTHSNRMSNPICGDRVECRLYVVDQEIIAASVESKGCALCKASASLLSEQLIGTSIEYSVRRVERFMMDIETILESNIGNGEALLFEALPTAPARRECVVLPWMCLKGTFEQN